jgi:hypothetical protein
MKALEMVLGNLWENPRGCRTAPARLKENMILIHLAHYLERRIWLEFLYSGKLSLDFPMVREMVCRSPLDVMMGSQMESDFQRGIPRWTTMAHHLVPRNLKVYLKAQLREHPKMEIRKDLDSVDLFQLVQETEQALGRENPLVHLMGQGLV